MQRTAEQRARHADWMRQVAVGDPDAFELLYDEFVDLTFSIALGMLQDRRRAEDATQDVWIKVWNAAGTFDREKVFVATWITTLAHRHVIDLLRRAATGQGDRPVVEAAYADDVRRVMEALTDDQRIAIELAYFGGYTRSEIAERLQASFDTITTYMIQGMQCLGESLGAEDPPASLELALYVLEQLDEREMARLERALATDPELRCELGAFEQVGARLADSVASVTAPASIKHDVMSTVRASAVHRAGGTLEDVADAAESASPQAERHRARRGWFGGPALTGALTAACLVLALVAIDLGRDLDDAQRRADQLEHNAESSPGSITDATPVPVSTSGTFGDARGSLVQVADDTWILLFHDVPSPGDGTSWQVWTADSNGRVENVDVWTAGDTQMLVLDGTDLAQVMVSHEPTTQAVTVPGSAPVADVKA